MRIIKRSYTAIVAIVLLTVLQGCDEIATLNAEPRELVVNLQSPSSAQLIEQILRYRFESYLPSMFSSLESHIDGSRIRFVFKRGTPPRKIIADLVTRQGMLVARVKDGAVWHVANDVADASATQTDGENALNITLSDQAGQLFERLTNQNLGEMLGVELDGEVLALAKIKPKELDELRLISVLLRSGPLPEKVKIVSNEL